MIQNKKFSSFEDKISSIITSKTTCPYCNNELTIEWTRDNIPFFGDVVYMSSICTSCSFKLNDTILLSNNKPCSYKLKVISKKDLNSKIIKSSSCTIEIKELGILVEPGTNSESYITNVEGLLNRIKDVVKYATNEEKNNQKKYTKGLQILSVLENITNDPEKYEKKITIILKDPFGNSKIINNKSKYRLLTEDEIEILNTGIRTIDISNMDEKNKNN